MNLSDIMIIFIIIIIVLFFKAIFKFLNLGENAVYNYKDDIKQIPKEFKQSNIKENKTIIGTSGRREIFIPNNAKHIFVCGTTGAGKTVALANFINSGINYNYPMLIIDGKGDTNENSIIDIVSKLNAGQRKVYVINLNDPKNSDKYNPFKNTSSTVIKDMLINLTEWTEEHYKLNTERYLQRLIDLLLRAEKQTSLKNIIEYININKFTALSSELVKKEIITKDEHINNAELAKASEKIIEGAAARFASIYESEIGNIFDDDGIDIYTALKENAIILFILNPLLYPETSPLFGNLIVIDSKKAVSKLFSDSHERIFFIFDEINVYASTALLDLVNKSRSANVTCILATQSLSDLDVISEHFREQIIENCNNYIFLRQNSPANAEKLADIIGTRNTINMTYQVSENGSTGVGSARRTREYCYHPDEIKNLKMGSAIYISKDYHFHSKINVYKCFK